MDPKTDLLGYLFALHVGRSAAVYGAEGIDIVFHAESSFIKLVL